MSIQVGRVVAGKYELTRLLGRGSMGEVWLAHHRTLGEEVALKLLTRQPDGGEIEDPATATARFQFEAQIAARLSRRTRHIVRVTDHGEEDGLAYLVMELLDGHTLEGQLMRRGHLPLADVPTLVAQVARALQEAHSQGVVHRDLKPANIFLTHDEDGQLLVKLLDFGIARAVHAQRLPATFSTGRGLVFGTPGYMSPEQARASAVLDHRCDLWALATVAYEALTGELPVPGADTEEMLMNLCAGRIVPVRERNPELPEPLTGFFDRAFALRIDERFASASELALAFESAAVHSQGTESKNDLPDRRVGSRDAKTWIIAPRSPVDSRSPPQTRWAGRLWGGRLRSLLALGAAVVAIVSVGFWAAGAAKHGRSTSAPRSPEPAAPISPRSSEARVRTEMPMSARSSEARVRTEMPMSAGSSEARVRTEIPMVTQAAAPSSASLPPLAESSAPPAPAPRTSESGASDSTASESAALQPPPSPVAAAAAAAAAAAQIVSTPIKSRAGLPAPGPPLSPTPSTPPKPLKPVDKGEVF